MTDKQGIQGTPFDMASCMAMIKKMMARQGAVCGCAGMMSETKDQAGRGGCDCSEMMSQMMAMWDKTQDKAD